MIYLIRNYRAFSISILLVCSLGCTTNVEAEKSLETLTIQTVNGNEINYQIEVADTTASRRRGLMFRMEMPTNQGMLLDFESSQRASIWMKNTYLPLDIIFINAKGIIRKIVPDAVPHSTALMKSETKVRAVLEVNAGQTEYHGINVGDRVIHQSFK